MKNLKTLLFSVLVITSINSMAADIDNELRKKFLVLVENSYNELTVSAIKEVNPNLEFKDLPKEKRDALTKAAKIFASSDYTNCIEQTPLNTHTSSIQDFYQAFVNKGKLPINPGQEKELFTILSDYWFMKFPKLNKDPNKDFRYSIEVNSDGKKIEYYEYGGERISGKEGLVISDYYALSMSNATCIIQQHMAASASFR